MTFASNVAVRLVPTAAYCGVTLTLTAGWGVGVGGGVVEEPLKSVREIFTLKMYCKSQEKFLHFSPYLS